MKDVLLTFVQNDNFLDNLDCEVFLHSIGKFKEFDKVCFVKNISEDKVKWLEKFFDFVVKPSHPINVPNCDRFICYYEWLCENPNYEYVFHLDFRDMILQKNPFDFMRQFPEKDLFIVKEGMKISESSCNEMWANNLNRLLSMHKHEYENDWVINAGNNGGKLSAFMNLCLIVFTNTNRPDRYVVFEQPIFNMLYKYFDKNPLVMVCDPKQDDFCVIGEGIKYGFVPVKFENGLICNMENKPYYIYHQWDRNEYAEYYRNKLKNNFFI